MSTLKVNTLQTVDGLHSVAVADLATGGGGGGTTDHGGLTGLADDDHPQYLNTTRGDARYATAAALAGKQDTLVSGVNIKTVNGASLLGSGNIVIAGEGGTGVTDHGDLTGLADDDHPQYLNNTRGDARYAPVSHAHVAADISNSTTVGRAVLTAADAAAARTAIGAGTGNGDVTLAGTQSITNKTVYAFGSQFDAGNSGTTKTINFASGQKQLMTLTGNCTVTFSFPGVGNYQLILKQDATGSRTVTWSGVSLFVGSASAPTINATANGFTIVSVYWDGTSAWLSAARVNA